MIWSAENLKTTNNQLMERLLKKAEAVEKQAIDFVKPRQSKLSVNL